jgi:hypothetical protein
MKKNRRRLKSYICFLTFIFFIFPAVSPLKARSDDWKLTRKPENKKWFQTNSPRKKKKKRKGDSKPKVNQSKLNQVTEGNWGAAGVNFVVEDGGVKIEYDCATGEISQKLSIDEQGGFSVNGVYTRRYPGALRVKLLPKPQPARFEGKISGDKLTLKVTLTETGETLEEVVLERNIAGRIRKCY